MRATLSVAMIARNEEKNLPRTLEAVKWADEIVIVDSGSMDRTPEIAKAFGAKHSFNRDFRGHPEQKTIAISKCTSDWILLLDADEVLTPELQDEIRALLAGEPDPGRVLTAQPQLRAATAGSRGGLLGVRPDGDALRADCRRALGGTRGERSEN